MEILDLRIDTDTWVKDSKRVRGNVVGKIGKVKVDCPLDTEECQAILSSIDQNKIREKLKE